MRNPRKSTVALAALAAAALCGLGGGAAISRVIDAPDRAAFSAQAQGTADTHTLDPALHDEDGVLNASEAARLVAEGALVRVPEVVTQVHYLLFADNDDNVNDTVERYLRDRHPELIGEDSFADGVLIVGVGLDPRQAFIFAGDDVAQALDLRESQHLERALDAIKPGVKDGDIPAGLVAGTQVAADTAAVARDRYAEAVEDRNFAIGGGGAALAGLAGGGVAIAGARRRKRARQALRARSDWEYVTQTYTNLAHRLDEIDLRAHSVTSGLIDAQLRGQWEKVRDEFLALDSQVNGGEVGSLRAGSPDEHFYEHREELARARETVDGMSNAEDNIEAIFQLERGDANARRRELESLRRDVVAAQAELADSGEKKSAELIGQLDRVREGIARLDGNAQAPGFVEEFLRLQSDYHSVLEQVVRWHYSDIDLDSAEPARAPRLTDSDYRPGYGINSFVPFWAVSTWHADTAAAQQASASSGTNTSFSSGFSGAGGSSSF